MPLCTVRDCRLPLAREPRRVVCPRGHSFDIASSGYINLLQPQDRRSKHPGDTAEAVAGRRRLHDRGVTGPLLEAIVEAAAAVDAAVASGDAVLDAGCGDGFYLGELARRTGCDAHGVDISIPAVHAAARRYPPGAEGKAESEATVGAKVGTRVGAEIGAKAGAAGGAEGGAAGRAFEWIVANADRFLPYADGSFSLALSITGRMNAGELRRVLREGGRLLVAIPSPEDLIELRGTGRDRVVSTVETFATGFTLMEQRRATTVAELDAEGVQDVLNSIYRPQRRQPVEAMRLTFSLDLLLFRAT